MLSLLAYSTEPLASVFSHVTKFFVKGLPVASLPVQPLILSALLPHWSFLDMWVFACVSLSVQNTPQSASVRLLARLLWWLQPPGNGLGSSLLNFHATHNFLLLNFSPCVLIRVPCECFPSLFLHLLPDWLIKGRHHFPVSDRGATDFCRMEKGPVKMVPEIIQLSLEPAVSPQLPYPHLVSRVPLV